MSTKEQSKTSPTNSSRACLCKDGKTYSRECCTGELHAQGIGSLVGGNNSTVTQNIVERILINP